MSNFQVLIDTWVRDGVELQPGASEHQLRKFEARHHVCLPGDFRSFYSVANGMVEDAVDPRTDTRFWSLDEITQAYRELLGDSYLGMFKFADYSIFCHTYAIELQEAYSPTNAVFCVGGDSPILLAESFSQYLTTYMQDR